jgi:UDP-glucose 4-epimerase
MKEQTKPARYFISGGAGFIGSHLVDRLMAEGNEVTVYDNLTSGKQAFVAQHGTNPKFKLIIGDLLNLEQLTVAMKNHDAVFHLAANPDARAGIMRTDLDLKLGTIATYNVLESMRLNGIKKLVFSSSGTVYGETPIKPLAEDYGPLLPISLYGASKLACEGLISGFCEIFGFQSWIFRFANVVGDKATHGVIYDFINKLQKNPKLLEILGDGTQEKPYIYVDDCVDGVLYGVRHANAKVNVYNIGCLDSTSVTTIAHIVTEEMNLKNVKLIYTGGDRGWTGDIPQVRYNVSKINQLGWKTSRTSDEAVRDAVKIMLGK